MRYYDILPDVAGGLARGTVMDTSVHPPIVSKLVYQMEGWIGDVLITSFPCFLVTEEAAHALSKIGFTGATFAPVEVTTSEDFREQQPDVELPSFVWLKVNGKAGHDDFGIAKNLNLVLSERVFDVFDERGLPSATIKPFDVQQEQR